jgi:tRNA(Glu) U13 pseudouridine synthase TruD
MAGTPYPFTEFHLTKRGVPDERAIEYVARELQVPVGQVSTHGRKDKQAVTTQSIVVAGPYTPSFFHPQMQLAYQGEAFGPARLGAHGGNFFSILVRSDATRPPDGRRFRNFYGPQRFGRGDVQIGKYLLTGDTKAALDAICADEPEQSKLQEIQRRCGHLQLEETLYSREYGFKRRFFVQKWQSHLWNLEAPYTSLEYLPVWSEASADLYKHWWDPDVLDEEILAEADRSSRPVFVEATKHRIEETSVGFRHEFHLRSGAYATVFLASLYELVDQSTAYYQTTGK